MEGIQTWWEGIQQQFYINFIQDDRWKYLWNGLGVTLQLTFCAVLIGIVLGVILAVLKFYVGIQGLRQVKGNARGDLHLKVARGTMILSMISLVLSLLMILKGGGDASDALLDLVAVIFLAQYIKFGKTLMTMK